MEESTITLSSTHIGIVRLDPRKIRGEGGEYDPCLVLPIEIELYQQAQERQIVIVRLSASLHLDQYKSQNNQFTSKVSYDLIYNMPICSVSTGARKVPLELRFPLTHAQLKKLENVRHEPHKKLYLHLEPVIAWNKHTGNAHNPMPGGISTLGESGWDIQIGMFSDLALFWLPAIEALRLDLAEMKWAEAIFPGMGYDNFRLIEVKLPTSGILVPMEAVEHFKEALLDYDRGFYRECLMKCRLVHEAIEKHLKVPSGAKHELGKAIALVLGWAPDSEQEKYLDGSWKPIYVMANASAHTPSTTSLLPIDARIVLTSTAGMLEYLGQLVP